MMVWSVLDENVHWAMGDGEVEGQGIEGAAELHLGLFRAEGVDCEWPWLIRTALPA